MPLCVGITIGLVFHPEGLFFVISGLVICVFFTVSLAFNKYITNLFYGFTLSIALYLTGLFIYNGEVGRISVFEPGEAVFTGSLSDYPEEKEKSFRLILRLDARISGGIREPAGGSLILYNKKDRFTGSLLPGDKLTIKCTPVPITGRGNPFEFDYRFYMLCQGARYYAFTDSSSIISRNIPKHRNLAHRALIIREKVIEMFRELIRLNWRLTR